MASIFDWSPTAGSNGNVDGINIAQGMDAGLVDNAMRAIMAIIRQTFSSTLQTFLSGASALGISSGGTGATTAAAARSNLIGSGATAATNLGLGTAALKAESFFAAALTGSLAAKGRIDLPVGSDTLRVCWGSKDVAPNAITTDTFQASITTVYGTYMGGGAADVGDTSNLYVLPNNSSSVTLVNGSDGGGNKTIYWIAVGKA